LANLPELVHRNPDDVVIVVTSQGSIALWRDSSALMQGVELTKDLILKANKSVADAFNDPQVMRLTACRVADKTMARVIRMHPTGVPRIPGLAEIEIMTGPSIGCRGVLFETALK
jgi:hypothetical protein